jgi:hypothetical protein
LFAFFFDASSVIAYITSVSFLARLLPARARGGRLDVITAVVALPSPFVGSA